MDVHDRQTSSLLISKKPSTCSYFFVAGYDFKIVSFSSFHPILWGGFCWKKPKQRISGSFVKSRSFRVKHPEFPGAFFRELSSKRSHRYPATSGFWSKNTSGMFFFLKLPLLVFKKRLKWVTIHLKMDDYKCVLILYLSGYIQTIANLEPSWGWQLRQNAEVTMIIPSVDGGGKGCMSPRNFVRCAHQHSSTHHYAHHLKNNAVEKKINCQSSPWFPQQKLKIRTASQCNTIYEGWVSSTSFTILYLRTCFLVMWERQMYIWQKHVFFVSHYFGAIIAIQAIPHFEDIWSTPAQVATCNYVSHVAKHLWLIYQNQKLSRESPLDPQTLAPKNLCLNPPAALPRSSGWARTATRGAETLKRPAVPMGKGRQDSADFNSWRWENPILGFSGESGNLDGIFGWSWTPKKNDIRQRMVGYCRY